MATLLRRYSIIICLLLFFTQCNYISEIFSSMGKEDEEDKKGAEYFLKLADKHFEMGGYYQASDYYSKVCSLKPKKSYPQHRLAKSYRLARNYKKAEVAYKKAADLDKGTFEYPLAPYYYAVMLKMNKNYDNAKNQFKEYLESKAFDELKRRDYSTYRDYQDLIERQIKGCEFAKESMEDPVKVDIENAGDEINTAYTEMAPVPIDTNKLIFGSLRSDTVISLKPDQEKEIKTVQLFKGVKKNNEWQVDSLPGPFNKTGVHTSNGAFSPDSNAFYFTRCKKTDNASKVTCAIYRSYKDTNNGKWGTPEKLGESINKPEYTSTHPTLGTYERGDRTYTVLYFASNQDGTRGGMDLWMSIQSYRDNEYRSARNLGRTINTAQDEMTPYFDRSSNTLYFSSDGHIGMGGFDIYKTEGFRRRWEDPENLGYPINSSTDDLYYTLRNDQEGYLVSNRPGAIALKSATCCDDIWEFRYKKILKFAVTGFVYDEADTTQTPLPGAIVTLYSLNKIEEDTSATQKYEEILLKTDSISGKQDTTYFFDLKPNKKYRLSAVKDGYLVGKKGVSTIDKENSDTMQINLPIKEIQEQESFIVENIYYDFDKATLKDESKPGLDSLVMFLEDNPQLIVEISAHTDSVGSDIYNERLSQRRAESVVDYLTDQGIDTARLQAKGYGESQPIAPNTKPDGSDNPEGRAKNRRTEFKILGEMEDVKLKYKQEQEELYNIEGKKKDESTPPNQSSQQGREQ